jgi:hypothetical protein
LVIIKVLQEKGIFGIEGNHPHIEIDLSVGTTGPATEATGPAPGNIDAETILFAQTIRSDRGPVYERRADFNPNHLDINQAIKKFGKEATMAALDSELMNMINKSVFIPLTPEMLENIPKENIVPSSAFFKGKSDDEGFFIEVKGRLVAGGHKQDESIFPKMSSPTVSPYTVFMQAAHAAEFFWFCATFDIKCAYLNASREGMPLLYVRLKGLVARRLIELAPPYGLTLATVPLRRMRRP